MKKSGKTPDLRRLGADPGLCGKCIHLDLLPGKHTTFVRCGLAETDPRFPRYPALPVRECAGFSAVKGRQ